MIVITVLVWKNKSDKNIKKKNDEDENIEKTIKK